MEFNGFKQKLQGHIMEMLTGTDTLFTVDVDKDALWETYLSSFPEDTNPMFRKRTEHDCSACRHFIKAFGNVVTIKNNIVTSIWDFEVNVDYQPVVDALSAFVKSKPITDIFVTKEMNMGIDKNHEQSKETGEILTWEHLYYKLPAKFLTVLPYGETLDGVKGKLRDVRNVFKRSLTEISEDSVKTVLELIAQGSLYKGEEWEAVLKQFLKHHKAYNKLSTDLRELYAWEQSVLVGPVIGKIKNHSIGTLLTDITEGTELDEAVRKYEAMVAPSNYKRPKAIFTKKMLEDAKKKLEALGYMESLGRRSATLDDITVNNTLFVNRDAAKRVGGSVFDTMAGSVAVNPKKFDRVEEISIDDFVGRVLPTATKVEALFENRHVPNMVSLIAPKNMDAKTLFKWDNGFSWAYSGNITDSMKERVKAAGGRVDGVLRFSIQWNDREDHNQNDFDAHCYGPNGHIFFATPRDSAGGNLDVDIRVPQERVPAVENITWPVLSRMAEGQYKFLVHNYSHRGGRSGFSAEIEYDGQIFSFSYDREVRQYEDIQVATVQYSRRDGFRLIESLPSSTSSRKAWGLDTNQFLPVSIIMHSPNYWDKQDGIGNRHYFFMLKDCINPESPNGFFNEYLKEDLLEHKRVFEALGAEMRVEETQDQLSGIGFSSTKRNSLIVKVEGQTSRTLKINF